MHLHPQGGKKLGATQGVHWMHLHPQGGKKVGAKFTGKSCKCTPIQSTPPARARVQFLEEIGEMWTVGVINFVLLACVLRATTKKVVDFFKEEKCTPIENPGYVYIGRQ